MKSVMLVAVLLLISAYTFFDNSQEKVSINATLKGIFIENQSSEKIFCLAKSTRSPGELSADTLSAVRLLEIKPNAYELLHYDSIQYYSDNDTITLYWWQMQETDAGREIRDFHSSSIDTRFYVKL